MITAHGGPSSEAEKGRAPCAWTRAVFLEGTRGLAREVGWATDDGRRKTEDGRRGDANEEFTSRAHSRSLCLDPRLHAMLYARRMRRAKRPAPAEARKVRKVSSAPRVERIATKPTIRAVAEKADVAISTVSRVVNGGRVSAGVKRRVQRVIDELGYSPSIAAQSLARRRTSCIGLAVNSTQSPWFSQILAGVETALSPSKKSVLLASMMLEGRYDPGAVLGWVVEGRVDGLIMVRYGRRDRPLLEAANKAGVPVVLIAPDLSAPTDFAVRCDNVNAGWLVAQHLVELGHRRIAFAGGPKESVDSRQRLQGLEDGMLEHGIALPSERVWFGPSYSRDAGVRYAGSFLALSAAERPTAVVLGNDPMAIGFMRTLLQHGVKIPGEVSVVGFDGTPDGEQIWPGLTTVIQPTRRMAIAACEALLDSVERRVPDRSTTVEFPVELLVRESTAGPRGQR
jgi:DNA-binding LacI/PurR family transcriptional regulator